jgi:ribosomal protein S6
MSKYELVVICSVAGKDSKKKVDELIALNNFTVVEEESLGVKELAYKIAKETSGEYFKIILEGDGQNVKRLEAAFNIEDKVLRYLTIALTPKLEKIRARVGEARVERQAKNAEKLKSKEA